MRVKCKCGKIAGYWYGPMIYKKLSYKEYLERHAFCEDHADVDNWAEYQYIGFHKKDWQWLKKKATQAYILSRNERLSATYWDVSHVREDGKRWYLGRYGGLHSFNNCKTLEDVQKAVEGYHLVEIKEGTYP